MNKLSIVFKQNLPRNVFSEKNPLSKDRNVSRNCLFLVFCTCDSVICNVTAVMIVKLLLKKFKNPLVSSA